KSSEGSGSDFAVARYNPDGSLDTDFGAGGCRSFDFGGAGEYAYGVAVDSEGRVLLTGETFNPANNSGDVAGARLGSDWAPDAGFGGGGLGRADGPAAQTTLGAAAGPVRGAGGEARGPGQEHLNRQEEGGAWAVEPDPVQPGRVPRHRLRRRRPAGPHPPGQGRRAQGKRARKQSPTGHRREWKTVPD